MNHYIQHHSNDGRPSAERDAATAEREYFRVPRGVPARVWVRRHALGSTVGVRMPEMRCRIGAGARALRAPRPRPANPGRAGAGAPSLQEVRVPQRSLRAAGVLRAVRRRAAGLRALHLSARARAGGLSVGDEREPPRAPGARAGLAGQREIDSARRASLRAARNLSGAHRGGRLRLPARPLVRHDHRGSQLAPSDRAAARSRPGHARVVSGDAPGGGARDA